MTAAVLPRADRLGALAAAFRRRRHLLKLISRNKIGRALQSRVQGQRAK
jgi:hypothetical protein